MSSWRLLLWLWWSLRRHLPRELIGRELRPLSRRKRHLGRTATRGGAGLLQQQVEPSTRGGALSRDNSTTTASAPSAASDAPLRLALHMLHWHARFERTHARSDSLHTPFRP